MLKVAERSAERRSFGRLETAIGAVVVVGGESRRNCIVRNFSEAGALLEFQGRFDPPERFILQIEGYPVEGACLLLHRTANKVGVSFKGTEIVKVIMREYQLRLAEVALSSTPETLPTRARVAPRSEPVSASALREQLLSKSQAMERAKSGQVETPTVAVGISEKYLRARRDNIVMPT